MFYFNRQKKLNSPSLKFSYPLWKCYAVELGMGLTGNTQSVAHQAMGVFILFVFHSVPHPPGLGFCLQEAVTLHRMKLPSVSSLYFVLFNLAGTNQNPITCTSTEHRSLGCDSVSLENMEGGRRKVPFAQIPWHAC